MPAATLGTVPVQCARPWARHRHDELSAPRIELVDDPDAQARTQRMLVVTVDDELAAMQIIVATLDELDEYTPQRVIRYLSERVRQQTEVLHR